MTYQEFTALRKAKQIKAGVDQSTALKLIDYLPKQYQAAHTFWSWVWMLSMPAFIAIAIFVKWWIGLLLLFIVTPLIKSGIKQSAAQFVLEHAEENEEFFNMLIANNILTFRK
jgi:hypothetical protein